MQRSPGPFASSSMDHIHPRRRDLPAPCIHLGLAAVGLLLGATGACRSTPEPPPMDPASGQGARAALTVPAPEPVVETLTRPEPVPAPATEPTQEPPPKKREKDRADLALEVEKKLLEVDVATLELQLAEHKARSDEAAATDALEAAGKEFGAVGRAKEHYTKLGKLVLLADAQLEIDQGTFRLQQLEHELEQMEKEYAAYQGDEHAKATGELVLWRHKTRIALQQRSIDQDVGKKRTLVQFTIPQKEAQLEADLAKKKSALARAVEAQERKRFEVELAVKKAKNKLALTRLELKRAEAELAAAD